MLKEVRRIEEELKLEPIPLEVFGNKMIERAKSIRYYLLSLRDTAKNNKEKETSNGKII